MASKVVECLGSHCREAGICEGALIEHEGQRILKLSRPVTKGIVYELNIFRLQYGYSWNVFYEWLNDLSREQLPSLAAIKVSISRLQKKRSELSRNKKHGEFEKLLLEPLVPVGPRIVPLRPTCRNQNSSVSHLEAVNLELATELNSTKEELVVEQQKSEELCAKLSKLSVRNVNRKLKRRDEKIQHYESEVTQLASENQTMSEEIGKLQKQVQSTKLAGGRNRVAAYRAAKQIGAISDEKANLESSLCELRDSVEDLQSKVIDLADLLDIARSERDVLSERLAEIESGKLRTKEHHQKYLDSVRQCCMELLSHNVGVRQVEPVIRSVLKNIASMDVEAIPKPSTLVSMLGEMKGLACQQLGEELGQDSNLTLHSDGITKFGQHYGGYQISTEKSAYSLGLSEMVTGSADQALSTLKLILEDIDIAAGAGLGERIVANIKNTMSDRHIVQKNFNCLLEDYRSQILPSVVSDWNVLSEEAKVQLSTLNNFFCGMHLIVGMADTASSSLIQWESSQKFDVPQFGPVLVRKSESGIVRLIRTACKALSKHGSEQSGVYQPFTTFLRSNGVARNPLATFRGNRFNILFYDAGALFYIAPLVQKFFLDLISS